MALAIVPSMPSQFESAKPSSGRSVALATWHSQPSDPVLPSVRYR